MEKNTLQPWLSDLLDKPLKECTPATLAFFVSAVHHNAGESNFGLTDPSLTLGQIYGVKPGGTPCQP